MSKSDDALSKLGTWIIAATVLGAVVGLLMGESAKMFAPIGDLFMQLIKMVVVPMVFFSLVGGGASLGNSKSAGKIGIVTFIYYAVTTIASVVIGLLFGELFKPGAGMSLETFNAIASNEFADKGALPGFWDTVIGFVPSNPFAALAEGNILQIIVFALFIGFSIAKFSGEKREFLLNVFNYMTEVLINIMTVIMYVAPIGVFALMADAVGTFGYDVLVKITYLVGIYILVLGLVNFVMIGGSVALFAKKVTFAQFFKSMYKVQLFAFSTASSMATLPLNMATVQNELKVSKETTSFALPLGATINMNGNAAYYALAACFFAQMFGMELTTAQYIAIIVTSTLGAVGQAGVPGPTLLVVAVLMAANIPIVALPILFGVDRIFDMLRTAVNITGDAACATIVDGLRDDE
ncbi:dicarboxylate/amino acid:cation symporter [Anaerosinus gibii]|uniref:Dicarboxylate/amino acid:cation symporter n=1 Tax=Selenobaculum gibii TaxID=3054208 RepID=A0A9Y2AFB5_9FIRM|nr:dicarboxylate/amino acid:cation symporter [Selenobaculum gbiensis]WIW70570.1 dicarboxylate/amino acid:cation symporter [Selenobaculum gbiensis]